MRNSIFKATIALTSALTMLAAVMSPVAPASAAQFHMGGFGGGGFHSGFRPGFGGFRRGFVAFHGRRIFHPGFFRNGVFIDGWWGPAVVAGAAWGAGCWSYQPVCDSSGNYLGQANVNFC